MRVESVREEAQHSGQSKRSAELHDFSELRKVEPDAKQVSIIPTAPDKENRIGQKCSKQPPRSSPFENHDYSKMTAIAITPFTTERLKYFRLLTADSIIAQHQCVDSRQRQSEHRQIQIRRNRNLRTRIEKFHITDQSRTA